MRRDRLLRDRDLVPVVAERDLAVLVGRGGDPANVVRREREDVRDRVDGVRDARRRVADAAEDARNDEQTRGQQAGEAKAGARLRAQRAVGRDARLERAQEVLAGLGPVAAKVVLEAIAPVAPATEAHLSLS
jgi:hypothetical protein